MILLIIIIVIIILIAIPLIIYWLSRLASTTEVSVVKYGIIGDGKTDWSTKLNNIISQTNNRLTLFFSKGVYIINGTVTINKPYITFKGEQGSIIKKGTQSSILISSNYCTLSNLVIDGNKQGYANIFVTGSYNKILYVTSILSGAQGIGLDGGHLDTNNACSFAPVSTCRFNLVQYCNISNNGGVGISQYNINNNLIINNTVFNNSLEGITVDVNSNYTKITDNQIINNCLVGGVGGIGMDNASYNVISSNIISLTQSSLSGIKTQNNCGTCNNNLIDNNIIINNTGYGVWLYYNPVSNLGSYNNTISNNIILNNNGTSIQIDSQNTDNTVKNNFTR